MQSAEAEKKLRSVYGVWNAFELLKDEYPGASILLMDSSASFDILVIDPIKETLVAVEVKAPRVSSRAARRLTKSQRELKRLIESKGSWKLIHRKCVIYGEPGKNALTKFVD
jgi:hypothetical protein